jgi:tRNA U34 5-carboxymethylaminomethyl modifying GTPase MnmE/TrmE
MRRPRWVVLTKTDLVGTDDLRRSIAAVRAAFEDRPVYAISAVSGAGVDALLQALMQHIESSRASVASDPELLAAEAELDADIAGDVLRQSLARRPQRPAERPSDSHDDADVVHQAE